MALYRYNIVIGKGLHGQRVLCGDSCANAYIFVLLTVNLQVESALER